MVLKQIYNMFMELHYQALKTTVQDHLCWELNICGYANIIFSNMETIFTSGPLFLKAKLNY